MDGICDDADGNGTAGDNPCVLGATEFCDDNCPSVMNPLQENADNDTCGDACDTAPADPSSC